MNKTTQIIIGVILLAFAGLVGWSASQKNPQKTDYDPYQIYTANSEAENGSIADHIKGNPDAKVIIFEYINYSCGACASVNAWADQLLEEYGDKIAIIQRHYLHTVSNPKVAAAAAAAVEAASLQGYWKPYSDLVFANQAEWFYDEATARGERFAQYFNEVSAGQGDLEKFKSDMNSKETTTKVKFDSLLGELTNVLATPSFYLGDTPIDLGEKLYQSTFLDSMRQVIDTELAK